MKPAGPIPEGFGAIDGELAIAGRKVSDLVNGTGGTPLFVYSRDFVRKRVADLRAAMPRRVGIHYAVKANPFPPLVEEMRGLVDGFDVASGGELTLVLSAGADPAAVSFAGPGKRDAEIEQAITAGITLNLESQGEARRALVIAERLGITPRLAIRVNPDFELRGSGMKMGGGAKPFGIDAKRVPALARELIAGGAAWQGLHIFAGSQSLDADAIIEAQANILELAGRLTEAIGTPLPKLNMGGGLGIPYFDRDAALDIRVIGRRLTERFDSLPAALEATAFSLELGRYLVGEAGVYLSRILDRKESHGQIFLVTDGGLHHQLAASGNFGTVVRRNYPVAIASRFTSEPEEEVNVVGCLCTPLDRLADQVLLPRAGEGDIVAIFCAGAYGASASPFAFLGQGPARETLV